MCGRFVSARQRQELIDEFRVELDHVTEDVAPDYNVAPTDPMYAVLTRSDDEDRGADGQHAARQLRRVRWGLVPSWARDPSAGSRLINARAETVATKPSFRNAFARRRCLIPADGFYEWRPLGGTDHGRPRKQPYFISRADGGVMAFAGVYELWRDASAPAGHPASWLWTAAIITARATDDLGWLHDRMPMVIDPGQWADWLDPGHRDPDVLREAMVPAVSGDLHTRPVSAAVSSVANDGPGLIATVAPLAGELGEDPAAVMAPAAGLAAAGPRADGTLF